MIKEQLQKNLTISAFIFLVRTVRFVCRGCVMDWHVTTQGSIPGGDGVKNEFHVFSQGTANGGAVSK